jgi:hypothetical protein
MNKESITLKMNRSNRMSGKYGKYGEADDDFRPLLAGRRTPEDIAEEAVLPNTPSLRQTTPEGDNGEEKNMQAKDSGQAKVPGAIPERSQTTADSEMKMKQVARSPVKKLVADANELPEYAEVQVPPGPSNGATELIVPGAVVVPGIASAPPNNEKDLVSRASSGTAATQVNGHKKDTASLSVGAILFFRQHRLGEYSGEW